jgi:hypothetical protein
LKNGHFGGIHPPTRTLGHIVHALGVARIFHRLPIQGVDVAFDQSKNATHAAKRDVYETGRRLLVAASVFFGRSFFPR